MVNPTSTTISYKLLNKKGTRLFNFSSNDVYFRFYNRDELKFYESDIFKIEVLEPYNEEGEGSFNITTIDKITPIGDYVVSLESDFYKTFSNAAEQEIKVSPNDNLPFNPSESTIEILPSTMTITGGLEKVQVFISFVKDGRIVKPNQNKIKLVIYHDNRDHSADFGIAPSGYLQDKLVYDVMSATASSGDYFLYVKYAEKQQQQPEGKFTVQSISNKSCKKQLNLKSTKKLRKQK